MNQFLIKKGDSFVKIKEVKGLRGGVLLYTAQANLQIEAEIAKNSPFWTKTK